MCSSSSCREAITQYRKQIFILLFQRLQSSKTTKFIKSECLRLLVFITLFILILTDPVLLLFLAGFLVFINLYCIKYGAIALQEIFDSIQPK